MFDKRCPVSIEIIDCRTTVDYHYCYQCAHMLRHGRGKYNGKINNADASEPAMRHEWSPANKGGRDGPG